MPLHLIITFTLLAALTLTAWMASGGGLHGCADRGGCRGRGVWRWPGRCSWG